MHHLFSGKCKGQSEYQKQGAQAYLSTACLLTCLLPVYLPVYCLSTYLSTACLLTHITGCLTALVLHLYVSAVELRSYFAYTTLLTSEAHSVAKLRWKWRINVVMS